VAFSGGGDSLALLAIAASWARPRGVGLTALHVDHGLREASRAEAASAEAAARALGVSFRLLRWTGPKPASGVQAAARAARHRLLALACAEIGATTLLLGHTLDDQAETVLMRLARSPALPRSLAGLEDVSPSPAWPEGAGLALARPLLGLRREDLRARLAGAGLHWIEDPSNENPAAERVRARRRLAELGPAFALRLAAIARLAADAEAERRTLALRALGAVRPLPLGAFALDRARFAAVPEPGRMLALEATIAAAAGAPGPIGRERLLRLVHRLDPARSFAGATLAGAAISPAAGGEAVICRDWGAVAGRRSRGATLVAGVWDGRQRVDEPLAHGAQIVPAQGHMAALSRPDRALLDAAPAPARRAAAVILEPGRPPRLAHGVFIGSQAIARRVIPRRPGAWCDVGAACAALGFGAAGPHMQSCRSTAESSAGAADQSG
jgi:tRNA(Ile)-lysidine synthase